MKKISFLLIIIIIVLFSCNSKKQEKETLPLRIRESSIVVKHTLPITINREFLKELDNWKEYKDIEEFITKFYNTSANEALSNALELKMLVVNLRDSKNPAVFNSKSFDSRINVLNNEVERFADITFIPAIKIKEINYQVEKIIHAFSALKSKINTVLAQKKFEEGIKISTDFIGLDITKMDNVSKNTIDVLEKKEKEKKIRADKRKLAEFKNTKLKNSFTKDKKIKTDKVKLLDFKNTKLKNNFKRVKNKN